MLRRSQVENGFARTFRSDRLAYIAASPLAKTAGRGKRMRTRWVDGDKKGNPRKTAE
jgi:hypothetical protein